MRSDGFYRGKGRIGPETSYGILPSCMHDTHHLDPSVDDFIDNDVIGMRNDLARSRKTARAEKVRMSRRGDDTVLNELEYIDRCPDTVFGDVISQFIEVVERFCSPSNRQHHLRSFSCSLILA